MEMEKEIEEKVQEKKDEAIEAEIMDGIPEEVKKVMQIGMSMQRFSGAMPSPLTEKINEKHIDKILDIASKDSENEFSDRKDKRKYSLFYVLIGVIVFGSLTFFLITYNKDELYKDVLKMLFAFIGGLGSGYGLKSIKDRNKDE